VCGRRKGEPSHPGNRRGPKPSPLVGGDAHHGRLEAWVCVGVVGHGELSP